MEKEFLFLLFLFFATHLLRSSTHLVNRLLLSYEYPSRNHSESGWTFSMHHADELLSPNVWKIDLIPKFTTHLVVFATLAIVRLRITGTFVSIVVLL
jgi:hypothetical protein